MHRMCKIIHTDFKPENVVIGLKEKEVAEIAHKGSLTTSKMSADDSTLRKFNQKITGSLQEQEKAEDPLKLTQQESMVSLSEYNTEGMTAKQKKNLRKKLQRKRKKLNQSRADSNLNITRDSEADLDISQDETAAADNEEADLDIGNIDVAIGGAKAAAGGDGAKNSKIGGNSDSN